MHGPVVEHDVKLLCGQILGAQVLPEAHPLRGGRLTHHAGGDGSGQGVERGDEASGRVGLVGALSQGLHRFVGATPIPTGGRLAVKGELIQEDDHHAPGGRGAFLQHAHNVGQLRHIVRIRAA